jgi:hypothetical protein
MARRHWRFIVRDAYGYAIQNARVFVYQPGTSTDFTGTCHDAASGGSVLANPFTTNAQGEVEGFFGTAQSVDVFVTDNTDAAYRAVDGPGATVSFTSFTEVDEVDVTPEDVIITIPAVGVAGDLVSAIVNPFTAGTAAAGASGKYADAAHVHPYAALTPAAPVALRTAANAGSLTNPARSDHIHQLWPGTTLPARTTQFSLTNTTTETVIGTLQVPANTVSVGSTFKITMPFYNTNSTTARTLEIRIRWGGVGGVVLGAVLTLVGTTTAHTDTGNFYTALVTIRTTGATGTAVAHQVNIGLMTEVSLLVPGHKYSAKTAAATIDTTTDKDLVVTAAWTVADAAVFFTVDALSIEQVV